MSDPEPFARCDREGCGHLWSSHVIPGRGDPRSATIEGCSVCNCDAHVVTFARLVPHTRPERRERFYRAVDSVLDRITR